MTGKWTQAGVPHRGWTCTAVDDLGAGESQICEMCEVTEIRYVHVMEHPEYPEPIEAGCICAGHMAGDLAAARQREQTTKNRTRRRSQWLSRQWHRSQNGAVYVNTREGLNITVFRTPIGRWKARIVERSSDRCEFSRRSYPSQEECQMKAFDAMCWLLDRRWGTQ